MPFVDRTAAAAVHGGPAGGLAHDVITRLAKLRSLFVIAQGTVFALSERRIGPEEAGRMLNVDYVVSGSLQRQGKRLTVTVELAETRTARIVWAEVFDKKVDDAFLVLDEIGNSIVASIASEIETVERNRAILKPPSSLDAWEAHHRGLWHMYRFNQADNERAQQFFETARAPRSRPSRAPMPACPSRIGRTPSRAGRSASRKSSGPSTRPGKASWSTIATRRRTGRWAGRSGCAAGRTSPSSSWSGRST